MRCHACDKSMSEAEIQYIPETKGFDCCAVCLEIAMDAAYSDGFAREEPLDDPELEDEYGDGVIETLEGETYRSVYDHCDAGYASDEFQKAYSDE